MHLILQRREVVVLASQGTTSPSTDPWVNNHSQPPNAEEDEQPAAQQQARSSTGTAHRPAELWEGEWPQEILAPPDLTSTAGLHVCEEHTPRDTGSMLENCPQHPSADSAEDGHGLSSSIQSEDGQVHLERGSKRDSPAGTCADADIQGYKSTGTTAAEAVAAPDEGGLHHSSGGQSKWD